MKNIILIALGLVYMSSYGQAKNDYKIMIDSAITMQKATYDSDIYLIDEKDQPYILSSEGYQMKFKQILLYETRNKRRLKEGINVWKVLPVLNGNRLTISIIDFIVTYKNNNYAFGNRGGGTVTFEYSCEKERWLLLNTKWSGI